MRHTHLCNRSKWVICFANVVDKKGLAIIKMGSLEQKSLSKITDIILVDIGAHGCKRVHTGCMSCEPILDILRHLSLFSLQDPLKP